MRLVLQWTCSSCTLRRKTCCNSDELLPLTRPCNLRWESIRTLLARTPSPCSILSSMSHHHWLDPPDVPMVLGPREEPKTTMASLHTMVSRRPRASACCAALCCVVCVVNACTRGVPACRNSFNGYGGVSAGEEQINPNLNQPLPFT